MNISLLEPIGVSCDEIKRLSAGLEEAGHKFTYYSTKTTDIEELKERTRGQDIVMIANNPYPDSVIEAADSLRMISVAFTGIDHVGTSACRDRGIMVCNASGYSSQTVAELVIGLTVSAMRSLNECDRRVRNGQGSAGLGGREISGRTVGIIGLGKIGLATAKLFLAFGARVIAYNRSISEEALALGIEYTELEKLLSESDIVSLHLPLNDSTRGFLSKDRLALMKNDAILINCARGPVIDNAALAEALKEGIPGFACIDVFDTEPPLDDSCPLLSAPNTLLTPHVGFISEESMIRRAKIVFDNVYAFLEGKPVNICRI